MGYFALPCLQFLFVLLFVGPWTQGMASIACLTSFTLLEHKQEALNREYCKLDGTYVSVIAIQITCS